MTGLTTLALWNDISMEVRPKVRYWLPAAAVDLEDIQADIYDFYERGFGGVEVVILGNLPKQVMLGDEAWGSSAWNAVIQVIADTTQKLGMTMDLANGPMWPISMPTVLSADDPATLCELTYGTIVVGQDGYYKGELPKRRTIHEEGTAELVHILAYQEIADKVLVKDSYKDLRNQIRVNPDGTALLNCDLPRLSEGRWLLFAFYRQPAVHKTAGNQCYVIDHLSQAGVQACEKYWDTIFEAYQYPSLESIFCDSLEYQSKMEWTAHLPEEFERRRGYLLLPYLPFIGYPDAYPKPDIPGYRFEQAELTEMVNRDYYEVLSQLYCEYHLAGLEKMAQKYGKSIRYQVAYNKPFEVERSAACVQIPENEALGRPAMDYQKTMAAAAHLMRKKRYSFECSAEFGNAYGQNYDDLMWWVKRSLMSGMNAQVLHGASYNGHYHGPYAVDGHMEGVAWPGYEGFGKLVSNYWNRTLSKEDARGCLDCIARLNQVFLKTAKIDCAIYRQSYSNHGLGSEFCFYPDDGALMNAGYSYETISPELLNLSVCQVTNGRLDAEGVAYKVLIIPEQEHVSHFFLERVRDLLKEEFPVVWIGNKPLYSTYFKEWQTVQDKERWLSLRDEIWNDARLLTVSAIGQVPTLLKAAGILPDVCLEGSRDLATAHRQDDQQKCHYYALYAYNRVVLAPDEHHDSEVLVSALYRKGTTKSSYEPRRGAFLQPVNIRLKGRGQVYYCDPWTGKKKRLYFDYQDGYMVGQVTIEEDELVLLQLCEEEAVCFQPTVTETTCYPLNWEQLTLEAFIPNDERATSFYDSHFEERISFSFSGQAEQLKPWSQLSPKLAKFAGRGRYTASLQLDRKNESSCYLLQLGQVSDTFRVFVNGSETDFPNQEKKCADITDQLKTGKNQIEIVVVSNLYNALQKAGKEDLLGIFLPYHEKYYGIWETSDKVCFVRECTKLKG